MNFMDKQRPAPQTRAAESIRGRTFTSSKTVVWIMLMILACGGTLGFGAMKIAPAKAAATDTLEYTVDPTNAAGGVYARYGPHTADTNQVDGYGVYPNEIVALLCGVTDGDPVGQNGNTTWHFVTDLSNTGEGNFWVSDYYLDTPNVASQITPGESTCANESADPFAAPAASTQSNPTVTAIFFSPNETPSGTTDVNFNDPTLAEVPNDKWAAGDCSDAALAHGQNVPPTVNTLIGWSLSRLAPIYFLAANPDRWSQIHTIILFDPGSTSEFSQLSFWDWLRGMKPPCDLNYDINSLLANWLQSNAGNQLLVFTGNDSEQNNFQGLWTYYFAGIWNQPFANQAIVCDYNSMGHPDVLQNFAGYVGDLLLEPMTSCPPSPDNTQWPLTQWNP